MSEKSAVPVTQQIRERALELLERHPAGIRWTDLNRMIIESDAGFHPKTVNGVVWLLAEKLPDRVYKPEKGLFRLTKFKSG